MENAPGNNDLLQMTFQLRTTPLFSFEKENGEIVAAENSAPVAHKNGFATNMETTITYQALVHVINQYLKNKRIQVSEGILAQHITIKDTEMSGDDSGHIKLQTSFIGSFDGTIHFSGIPYYDADTQTIELKDISYDVATKNILLKAAKWLFKSKIGKVLEKVTTVSLSNYYTVAAQTLDSFVNREWANGVRGEGAVTNLKLVNVQTFAGHMVIRIQCGGDLMITINELDLAAAL